MAKGQIGGDLPWTVNVLSGQKGPRMQIYRWGMAALIGGAIATYYYQQKSMEASRNEAVEKYGRHGEKAHPGQDFQENVEKAKTRFPGIPSTDTNVRGGHDIGTMK